MRRLFDQYVNLRPAYLFDGVQSPLRDKAPVVGVKTHHVGHCAQCHQRQKGVELGLRTGVELAAQAQLGA